MGLFKKKKLYKITYTEKNFPVYGNCRYKTSIISAKNEVRAVNKFSRDWCNLSYVVVSVAPYRVSRYSEVVENFVNSRGLR
jgi:hypothetical protein